MTDTKKLKDQIQQDIQKVIRKINLDCNYYEDLQSDYDADSDELAVLENQLNSEEEFLKMLRITFQCWKNKKELKMNFDIKDLKSWANRHDVETKSVTGFFGNSLLEIDNEIRRYNKGEKDHLHELYQISDNGCYCFGYATYFADTGAFSGTSNFAFFLPLDAVKEDKTYRACRTVQELYELVFNTKSKAEESFYIEELLDTIIHLRNKETGTEYFTTISIITRDINDYIKVVVPLKGYLSFGYCSFTDLFNKYEIEINGEWKPFGVLENCTRE